MLKLSIHTLIITGLVAGSLSALAGVDVRSSDRSRSEMSASDLDRNDRLDKALKEGTSFKSEDLIQAIRDANVVKDGVAAVSESLKNIPSLDLSKPTVKLLAQIISNDANTAKLADITYVLKNAKLSSSDEDKYKTEAVMEVVAAMGAGAHLDRSKTVEMMTTYKGAAGKNALAIWHYTSLAEVRNPGMSLEQATLKGEVAFLTKIGDENPAETAKKLEQCVLVN